MHVVLRAVGLRELPIFIEDTFLDENGESLLGSRSTLFAKTLNICNKFCKILIAHCVSRLSVASRYPHS